MEVFEYGLVCFVVQQLVNTFEVRRDMYEEKYHKHLSLVIVLRF